jgi:thymidylate synthase (FAD)
MVIMARLTVDAAEAVLDQPVHVLDKGFVRLVDYLGGDARIVQAARVSYGDGTKTVREDAGLIDYLMRNWHTSPFEQVVLTFHLKMPVFVARQWLRHRTARLNEISGRYSVMQDEFYLPDEHNVRYQSQRNKQGSSNDNVPADVQQQIVAGLAAAQTRAYGEYSELLEGSIARELARVNLPLSLYTEMYWQIDLHNLFHFLRLRLDDHAQYEIRVYAEVLADIAKAVAPLAYKAFEDHRLNARNISGGELELLRECIDTTKLTSLLEKSNLRPSRQRELLSKLGLYDLEPVS